jgi:putative ABC transport system permease protein
MFKNYLKIAWRNFTRNKFYSVINVLGLSIGLFSLILIMLFVTDELSYDNFHEKSDQIYFVGRESQFGKNVSKNLSTPYPVGPSMNEEIPEVEHYLVTMWPGSGKVSRPDEDPVTEDNIMMSTEDFFEVFSFPLVAGNPETVLDDPSSVVLTQEMADKYFPDENPIGKTIRIQRYDDKEYTITGIAKNMENNSYVSFDFITSILGTSSVESNRDSWGASMFHTYVQLQDKANWKDVEGKVASIVEKNIDTEKKTRFFPVAMSDLYLSELVTADGFKGSMKYIYIFSAIGIFILLLACINYMNLATARAARRSIEVGIRKAVGAQKKQLLMQFMTEAVILTIAAFFVALFLSELFLPFFNDFLDKNLSMNLLTNYPYILSLFGISVVIGIISGVYPAFFLSRFRPAGVLKGTPNSSLTGSKLRKTLVVTQFAVTTVLIICTLVAFNQLGYVLQKDLGFEKDQVMYIQAYQLQDDLEPFKRATLQQSGVINASAASGIPSQFQMRVSQPFDPKNPENEFSVHLLRADTDYKDVLGLELVAGRYFDENRSTDRDTARVINEAMVQELEWGAPEEAIGRKLNDGSEVIGVVKDFHFESLHNKITPVYIKMKPSDAGWYNTYNLLAVRFNPEQTSSVIDHLQAEWDKQVPGEAMTYHFLDDKFAQLYDTDRKLSQAFSVFAGIAIFIACIGLLGLAAFSAQRRTKEIGIRKVLGATITNIVGLLSKDFLKLVALGFVIAVPIAWYAMNQWLADFAYKIEIGPAIFFLAGGLALLISLATVSWQSIRAALANPVDSLRSE